MARITSRQAQELMDAYAKVYEPKEEPAVETPVNETPVEDIQENIVRPSERFKRSQQTQTNLKQATAGYKFSGTRDSSGALSSLRADPVKTQNNQSTQPQQRPAAQQPQQRSATGGQPQANAGTQKPVAQGGGSQQQPVKTVGGQGNRQRPVKTGGIQAGKAIRGGLSRLGSLAGKAVAGARNVASNVKQGAQAVAGGIKQGAQAVAGALANKGPIQGRASGPQRRAQQAQTRAANAAPVATRPVQGQQPAAKPVVTQQPAAKPATQLTGAQRAQQMAKKRIAAGRNTVTGELKSKPPVRKVTSVMDMEGYDTVFDDTVQFLVSEGHAKDVSEAMSIMSESEFIDAFNQELNG